MKSRKLTQETSSFLSILSVVLLLAVVGIVSQGFLHTRFDLTEDKQFTLSRAAVKTLEGLPDLVTIKAVISSDLPTQFLQIKTHVTDLLEEFEARAKGKLDVIIFDPGEDGDKKEQAKSLGIQEVQLQEQSSQGLEIKKGFFGMAITYGDKKEVIPVLNNLQTFEYDLIVKIKKLTGDVKTIGVIDGQSEQKFSLSVPGENRTQQGFQENFPTLKEEMEKLYTIRFLDLSQRDPAEEVDLAIVAAPKKLNDVEKFRLDQFLMKGKSVLFFSPGVNVNLAYGLNGNATFNDYESLLKHYGLSVKKNVILEDRNFQLVPFGNSFFPLPYPYWVVVLGEQLNADNPITSGLGQLTLPWASSLEVDSSKLDSNSALIPLASSSDGSWEESGRFNLYPKDLKEFLPVNQGPRLLVAMKSGRFSSFYAQHPLPSDSGFEAPDTVLKETDDARILVVGNAMFASDFYMGLMRSYNNLNFVLNAIDQMALDPDLIRIRSRDIDSRPIPETKKNQKLGIVTANILISPLILLAVGIAVGFRRRKRDALS